MDHKKYRVIIICQLFLICLVLCLVGITAKKTMAADDSAKWVSFPYNLNNNQTYEYIYVVGGYHSVDNGCPAWGTSNESDIRFIGESMGDLVITYQDGTEDKVPLMFGYTMWWRSHWQEPCAPFNGEGTVDEMKSMLQSTLHLYGAYEGNEKCVFKVKVQNKVIKKIQVADDPTENGSPVFTGVYLVNGNPGKLTKGNFEFDTNHSFFDQHTIDSTNPFPERLKETFDKINYNLLTYEEDYANAPEFTYPAEHTGSKVYFKGTSIAEIASGVVYHNVKNLVDRTDDDGFMHTSYDGAPSWRYDGFGCWVVNANSYYDSFYSRDDGRAIMSLLSYGDISTAEKTVNFGNKNMMYFPENNITFNGVNVPGHYTVVVNKPMLYSTTLVPHANWPTRYTEKAFGKDYQNLGNQETDGHGLMMLANYNVWKNQGATVQWVNDNWKYINEGAAWILWCFDNPDISLVKNGLLYAESEAGMMEYTLYCNVPCYLGLCGYVEMAEAAGKTEEAAKWKKCADDLRAAITDRFAGRMGNWVGKFGFFHDPVVTMMSDYFGYDTADMIEEWVTCSRGSYEKDIASARKNNYFGNGGGVGYDHSMITQSALLMDQMKDAGPLVINLSKLSYAPRLPEPYIVPEALCVDIEAGVIRRQGDLGNLVQVAEALKCYSLVTGVSPVNNNILKLMPRLPENWEVDVQDYDIPNVDGTLDMIVTYPKDGAQTAQITLKETSGFDTVSFRFGPLPMSTTCAAVQIDGVGIDGVQLIESGDSKWAWVSFTPSTETQRLAVIYGDTVESLPSWPDNWATPRPGADPDSIDTNVNNKTFPMKTFIIAAVATVAVIVVAVVIILVVRKKKGMTENV